MARYILRRILQMIPTIFGVIVITFILFNLVGGSPGAMTLGHHVSPRLLEEFDEVRGFNKPLLMGLWSGTRAFEDADFSRSASPWQGKKGVQRQAVDTRSGWAVSFAPDESHLIPLRFPLHPETRFRWSFRYRLSEGAHAWIFPADADELDKDAEPWREGTPFPAAPDWRQWRTMIDTSAQPDQQQWMLYVTGGTLEIDIVRLQRRANHWFDSQFVHYLDQIRRFDLGYSSQTDQPIGQMIRAGIIPSLTLTVPIFAIGLVLAICISLVCAFFRDTWLDRFFVVLSVALMSINYLVWIIVGQYVLAFQWGWFPVWGYESMAYLLLPILIGVVSGLGTDVRFYRTVMLDEMYKEYVRTAFAKGVSRKGVLFKHVLKNALLTVVTNVVIAIPFLYTGSLLLESFFGIPGLGYLGINAINSSDVDVIRAIVLIGSVLYVVANLFTDICYAWVDPRVKLT